MVIPCCLGNNGKKKHLYSSVWMQPSLASLHSTYRRYEVNSALTRSVGERQRVWDRREGSSKAACIRLHLCKLSMVLSTQIQALHFEALCNFLTYSIHSWLNQGSGTQGYEELTILLTAVSITSAELKSCVLQIRKYLLAVPFRKQLGGRALPGWEEDPGWLTGVTGPPWGKAEEQRMNYFLNT